MIFLKKLKEVLISIIPIVAIVLVLHFSVCPFPKDLLIKFLISCVLLCVGQVLFLTGVDSTIMPMGEMVGGSTKKVSTFFLFLLFAFLFGMFATIAEPDVQVLCGQIVSLLGDLTGVSKTLLLFIIGAGVGLFVAFGLLRIVKKVPIKVLYLVCLGLIFLISAFVPDSFVAIAFDAGGSTVGIVTTPFLLSLTAGIVERSSKNSNDNFGVIGIAGLGPVIAILLLSLFVSGDASGAIVESQQYNIFVEVLYNTIMAIVPLVGVFYIFEIIYIKLPRSKKKTLILGVVVTFVGLYLFLFGINYGLTQLSNTMGEILSQKNIWIILVVYIAFAFAIVFTEPSIRVLGAQIEAETQGNINRKIVNVAIAVAMTLAVSLSAIRIYFNISIWYFLGIGYGLIILLMMFSPSLFVSIAFDSGSVASGPMATALLMPAMVAMSGTAAEGFGFIAFVSMMPVLVIEILGVVYNIKIYGNKKVQYKKALRIAYGIDKYSNMEKLEIRHKKLMEMQVDYEKKD